MTRWRVAGRTVPKRDSADGTNQDRWAFARGPRFRLAVADGATQTFRPELWAELLVGAFVSGDLRPGRRSATILEAVVGLADDWRAATMLPPDALWHQEARSLRGSAAALVGVEIARTRRSWSWRALAVGDANLLLVDRQGRLRRSFPLARVEYEPRPLLVTTRPILNEALRGRLRRARGTWRQGDTMLLASDAVAWWLLERALVGPIDVPLLRASIRTRARFDALVESLRANGVPDDDMTLVLVDRR